MRFLDYIKDKMILIFLYFVMIVINLILFLLFDTNPIIIVYVPIIMLLIGIVIILYNYYRKKDFYNKIEKTLTNLDKKYLISEIVDEPSFLEGRLLSEYLYDIDKSYLESIGKYKNNNIDFKDYIELWCHEIKTPIATSKMIIENNKSSVTNSINEEVNKIENFVEQVLYYARSEAVEKDYIIKETDLNKVINNVIKKNKKILITKKIKVDISKLHSVKTDSKWLEFIIDQIISNSIKYSKDKCPIIKIYDNVQKNNTVLYIEDNGIGIKESELDRVFDKGFTGTNGRIKYNSTGIGLYLCKKLCDKIEHNILIKSEENNNTTVMLIFPNSSMLNDID